MSDRPETSPTEPAPPPESAADKPSSDGMTPFGPEIQTGSPFTKMTPMFPPQPDADSYRRDPSPIDLEAALKTAREASLSLDTLPPEERSKLQLMVRGGTTSSAYDKEMAQKLYEADVRRAEDEADKKIAQVPIERGGGMMFEQKLTDTSTGPRVLIKYVGKSKDVLMEQLCELVTDDITGDSMLIFVCPECFGRGVPSGFAQCHARASHRQWHLDKKEAGQVKAARNSDMPNGIEYYMHAGDVMDSDSFRCDNTNCGCSFKIHKNVMYRVG